MISAIQKSLQQFNKNKSISPPEITLLLKQFATLMSAGIPIIKSCDILANSQEKSASRLLLLEIKHNILKGNNLYDSMRHHPQYFDELTCRLIQMGEQTGKIETLLLISAAYKEKNQTLIKNIQQALFYPCLTAITALIIAICMFIFVIPHFADLFQDNKIALPLITKAIFCVSTKIRDDGWIVLLITFITALILLLHKNANPIQRMKQIVIRLPIIRAFLLKVGLARFARHLALTLEAGIPITTALFLTANACGSIELTPAIIQVCKQISAGSPLHQAMTTSPVFPILLIQMIKIGEESGKLEDMANKFADFAEADIDHFTEQLNVLLEPLIMLVLGVLIGGLVIGMYLPIFKLGSAI